MNLPRGPSTSPLRQAIEFGTDPWGFFERCEREFGDLFTIRFPNLPPAVTTSDPKLLRELLALRPEELRSDLMPVPIDLGVHSVQFMDGDPHLRMRRENLRGLKFETLKSHGRSILRAADRMIDQWQAGANLRFKAEARSLSLDVMMDSLLGKPAGRGAALRQAILDWTSLSCAPWVAAASLAIGGHRLRGVLARLASSAMGGNRFKASPWLNPVGVRKATVLRMLAAEVRDARREGDESRTDFLAQLALARNGGSYALEVDEVVDQVVTHIAGGVESTANTLCWAVQQVYGHPSVLARLRQELEVTFPHALDPRRIGELRYLDACIKETLRLTPTFPVTARVLARPKQVRDHLLPAKTMLWFGIYLVQRRADVWDEPARFSPERFLDASPAADVYMPWGGGVRRCLGAQLATYQMQVILARLIQRVDLSVAPAVKAVHRGISVIPAGNLPVHCKRVRAKPEPGQSFASPVVATG